MVGSSITPVIPEEAASQLPKSGKARVIVLTAELTVLNRRLGQLSARDEAAVRGAWNQLMRL